MTHDTAVQPQKTGDGQSERPGYGGLPRFNPRVREVDRKALLNSRVYRAALVLGMIVLLVLVSFTQKHLNVARDRLGLTRVAPLENAPPVLAFTTVALGGFRGLIANMLWLRATDLQEQDKYFEMVQLADWITKLQPHFVTVWVHQAWNMAYNISIKFTDPADRWQWVRRGIELLRDEGLKYNPNEALIYRELAWFFQHKMGADLDDAHKYYKAVWVNEMNQVFGRERPSFSALLQPTTPEAQRAAKLLREKFKMNPEWMKEVDDLYGPLEWHLPESHAIYWAYVALEKTDKRKLKKEDLITCRRVIFQSLQLAFRRGRLVYPNKNSDAFMYAPNLSIVAQANKAYLQMIDEEPGMRDNIANGHKNFIKWAVYYLYLYGQKAQANEWWKYLHEKYPAATPPDQDLEDYALQRATETVGEAAHDDAKAMLVGFVREALFYIAIGEETTGVNYLNLAEKFRARFQEAVEKSVERVGLPTLDEVKQEVLNEMLDPEMGLDPTLAAQLRTNLGLPTAGPLPRLDQPSAYHTVHKLARRARGQATLMPEPTMTYDTSLDAVLQQVWDGHRIGPGEARRLYDLPLEELGALAERRRQLAKAAAYEGKGNEIVTYIVDRNINYTNICNVYCKFCAFYRVEGDADAYVITYDELDKKIEETLAQGGTQILMQGGHHPKLTLQWYLDLLSHIKSKFPQINIHGFSPSEFVHFRDVFGLPVEEIIAQFAKAGLGSIPGGGGEILVDRVRKRVSPLKAMSDDWLGVMDAAHQLGLNSSATMMFGHVESVEDRIEHLERVRAQQDKSKGFTAFIAWKFQAENTRLRASTVGAQEYLRTQALSRIYLDNFANIQSSWVTQGPEIGQVALKYGANDLGSIMIEENVVSQAGATFRMGVEDMHRLIRDLGYEPRQRDNWYRLLN